MSAVDEIDTILLIKNMITNTLVTKANFTANLHANGQRTRMRNSPVCEIITSCLPLQRNSFSQKKSTATRQLPRAMRKHSRLVTSAFQSMW